MKDIIHIAFGVQDNDGSYSKYVGTTIISILENTKYKVCFHILHDNLFDDKNKLLLLNIVKKYNQLIVFHSVLIDKILIDFYKNTGMFYRLYLLEYGEINLDKVIYLDGDILVNKDINEIWNIDLKNYYCAVVKDVKMTRKALIDTRYYKNIGIDYKRYFNSGVIYFNCRLIKEKLKIREEIKRFFSKNKNVLMPDQDFLNYLFQKNVIFLDKKYNFIVDNIDDIKFRELENYSIIHFAGRYKPWNCKNKEIIFNYYRYFSKIVDNNEELCKYMSKIPEENFKKRGLKFSLLEYNKKNSIILSILCILKGLLPDKIFYKWGNYLWKYLKYKCLYNVYYIINRK